MCPIDTCLHKYSYMQNLNTKIIYVKIAYMKKSLITVYFVALYILGETALHSELSPIGKRRKEAYSVQDHSSF